MSEGVFMVSGVFGWCLDGVWMVSEWCLDGVSGCLGCMNTISLYKML